MKKKKSVLVWTILGIVGILMVVGGFLFTGVQECASLYSKRSTDFSPLAFNELLEPLVSLFKFSFKGNLNLGKSITLIVILALVAIAQVALIVASIVKRRAKYIGQIIFVLLIGFVGVYILGYVTTPYEALGDLSIVSQIIRKDKMYNSMLLFKGANIIADILFYVLLAGSLLAFVSAFGITISTLTAISRSERKVKIVEEKEIVPATAVAATAPVEEKPAEAPVEKKTKKVVLVVKRYDAFKNTNEPVIERPTKYPHEPIEAKQLTKEDIRSILREELDARQRAEENTSSPSFEEVSPVVQPTVAVSESDIKVPDVEEPLTPTPIIITIPEVVKEEKVVEKKPVEKKAPVEKKPSLSKDEIRDIIRSELSKALASLKEPEVVEEVIETEEKLTVARPTEVKTEPEVIDETVHTQEEVVESAKEEVVETIEETTTTPETKVEVVEEAPAVTEVKEIAPAKEEKVEKPAPTPVVEPVVETASTAETSEEGEESTKIERISFAERMKSADDELKDAYNQIKSLLISYGLKSRVSNGGDAFRLHKVNYCKIAVAGKSLKLYLALNPEDYKNSTLPIKDASSKAIYKDIPLVFKVKSGLSIRRAEQLITEMMDKHGVEQVDRVETKDYVSLLGTEVDDSDNDD